MSASRYTPWDAARDCLPGSVLAWLAISLLTGAMAAAGAPMGPIVALAVLFGVAGPLLGWWAWWDFKRARP